MEPNLLIPRPRLLVPKPPSYIKLMMAFGLGEGATLFDKSRYRAHGTIEGPDWATGLHGKCLDFDSSVPDYVEIPSTHTQLDFTSEDFSLVFRIYPTAFAGGKCIYERGSYAVDGFILMLGSNKATYTYTSQAGVAQENRSSTGYLDTDTWATLGITRDGVRIYFYIDGVDRTSTTNDITDMVSADRSAKIGVRDNKSSNPYNGKIEFLAIFGVALSASEHKAWHNALA